MGPAGGARRAERGGEGGGEPAPPVSIRGGTRLLLLPTALTLTLRPFAAGLARRRRAPVARAAGDAEPGTSPILLLSLSLLLWRQWTDAIDQLNIVIIRYVPPYIIIIIEDN